MVGEGARLLAYHLESGHVLRQAVPGQLRLALAVVQHARCALVHLRGSVRLSFAHPVALSADVLLFS